MCKYGNFQSIASTNQSRFNFFHMFKSAFNKFSKGTKLSWQSWFRFDIINVPRHLIL